MQIDSTKPVGSVPEVAHGQAAGANRAGSRVPARESASSTEPSTPAHSHVSARPADNHEMEYQIIDDKTGDVVTQIPSPEVLAVAKEIEKFLDSTNSTVLQTHVKG